MNRCVRLTKISVLTLLVKSAKGFPTRLCNTQPTRHCLQAVPRAFMSTGGTSTGLGSQSGGGDGGEPKMPPIRQIGKAEMKQIVDEYAESGREGSGYVVIDVRFEDEIQMTGKLSPNTITLPVPIIMQYNVFAMDAEEFEEVCKFEKPEMDETLVFSCAAGIRSQQAAFFAAKAGYTKLVNYAGGANEWFY